MVIRRVLIWLEVLLTCAVAFAVPGSVNLHYQVVNNFPVKFVSIDMKDPDVLVTTAVARSFPNGLEGWGSFISRLRPDAAMNGTYFSTSNAHPIGDIALNGALLYHGEVGTALCIDPHNRVVMQTDSKPIDHDLTGYTTVLCAGPRLISDGSLSLYPHDEGFRDRHVLGSARRSAVVLRKDGLLLLMTVLRPASLSNLAFICLKLGAVQAMAFDGGSSSALYANGRTVTHPGRRLSNILAVYSTRSRYQSVADQFSPGRYNVLAKLLTPLMPAAPVVPMVTAPPPPCAPEQLLNFIEPDATKMAQGVVPITVKFADDSRVAWCSLRINGKLCSMSNTHLLAYRWDSSKESDGSYTLEASLWTLENKLVVSKSQVISVHNATVVTEK